MTMQCIEARKAIDAGQFEANTELREHLGGCELCAQYAENALLEQRLGELMDVPAPRDGFFEGAVAKAMAQQPRSTVVHMASWGRAAAAMLLIGIAGFIGVEYGKSTVDQPSLVVEADSPAADSALQYVNVVIHSAEAQDEAMVAVELWGDVELQGYPGEVELVWRTKLLKGANLLKLPLRHIGANGGQLTVSSVVGGDAQRVQLDIAAPADRRGMYFEYDSSITPASIAVYSAPEAVVLAKASAVSGQS